MASKRHLGENRIVGIDRNYIQDFFMGISVATAIFLFGKLFGIIAFIGIPTLPESIFEDIGAWGDFFIIVVGAAIFETILFQEFMLDFFDSKLKLPFFVSSILSSIVFALFHLFVYLSKNQNLTAFTLVFVWGMIFCYLRKYTNSILSVVAAHGTLNFILEFIVNRKIINF